MSRRRKPFPRYEAVEILDAGSEGKSVARVDNRVIFVPFVVPGDVVDIQVVKKKKNYFEGRAEKFHKYSEKRIDPQCRHFGICGGCKWQNMDYADQLHYKQKQVVDNLERIGRLKFPEVMPILGSEKIYHYRNKLEYTFSNRRWFVEKPDPERPQNRNGLGFHLPGLFDRILDIETCYLQRDPSDAIRLAARDFALENEYEFYDVKTWDGYLRNLIIRTSSTGDLMVVVVFRYVDHIKMPALLDHLSETFPEISSMMYVINDKRNDDISDLEVQLYKGDPFMMEEMDGLKFKIGPKSFFQTNRDQALKLYSTALEFAGLSGEETVYDLYTGTGTIAAFLARYAKKVIGIEYIESAIKDANENSALNGISNTRFFAGDMHKVLTDAFIEENGRPDVIVTDPPRAGMHERVVRQIMKVAPEKVVYVSCNPATQARDLAIMASDYRIEKVQPVDMFPQTHHVENIVQLKKLKT
ncbi:MAG: 23S rRNA (uracil(1939)-C(5))-methyltransferase RlmD [Bacteroidales bacterium]|jgi:23S rRNA (uracil1939-C5)-methyltransferase|nr:23S rRNA (uracil(1939)-C(5))-methyltransferase RlmD [Bacteroidales bacterium]